MNRMRAVLAVVACAALLAACGSSNKSSPSGSSNNTPTAPSNSTSAATRTMSAVIDGVPWTATAVGVQAATGATLILTGTDASGTTVGVTTFGMVGTNSVRQGGAVAGSLMTSAGSWQANGLGNGTGSGTVSVSSYTATGAAGTFSFTVSATAQTGAIGTRNITNGKFSVAF